MLFKGKDITSYAKQHFDVLSPDGASKSNGLLQPGDILMFNSNHGQQVSTFKGYDPKGHNEFYGSQVSAGPTFTSQTEPGQSWNGGDFQLVGALRAKSEFRIHDPDHGYKTGPIDYTNARARSQA